LYGTALTVIDTYNITCILMYYFQGYHFSGKPGNVREVCNVRGMSGKTVVFKEQNMYSPVLIESILY